MRPQGEIRQALKTAAAELVAERGPVTWRDLADHTQVGYRKACVTVRDMVRAGDLVNVGFAKRAHSVRWMALYEPCQPPPRPRRGFAAVAVPADVFALAAGAWPAR